MAEGKWEPGEHLLIGMSDEPTRRGPKGKYHIEDLEVNESRFYPSDTPKRLANTLKSQCSKLKKKQNKVFRTSIGTDGVLIERIE